MRRSWASRSKAALVLALPWVGAMGCAHKVSTKSFQVVAVPMANADSPVPLDVVIVRADALLPVVTALSAKQWFLQREQLRRDHPGGIDFRSWEFVPGQTVDINPLPFPDRKGVALFVFADYLSEGVHRLRVDPMEKFRLVLRPGGFEAEPIR